MGIELQFACENGHAFRYAFRFRKGWTLVSQESGTAQSDGLTIWRYLEQLRCLLPAHGGPFAFQSVQQRIEVFLGYGFFG